MPKQLTEAQAWRKVARAIEKAEKMPGRYGLCMEITRAYGVFTPLSNEMMDKLRPHTYAFFDRDGAYAYPPGKEWEARCLAAYWMALEAEEEENA